ncbi:MAG: DUF342 domain-containing protein [Bacillota bacterium]
MSEQNQIKIKAKDKKEALTKAYQHFQNELNSEVVQEEIKLNLVDEEGGFLGIFGGKKVYQAEYVEVEEEEAVDGTFELKINQDGIFLKVNQPQGAGTEVELKDVEEQLEDKEIEEVDYEAVSEALSLDGEEVKIAERKPELDRDAEVNVEIAPDELSAHLNYKPALGGENYSAAQVIDKVKEEGVTYGINKDEFLNRFEAAEELENFEIAVGEEAIPGDDAQLEFEFDTESDSNKVKIDEEGKADFYNLGKIINVEEGEVLVSKTPATEGTAGKTVTGEKIAPPSGEDIKLPAGKNVKVGDDGLELISEMEGQVSYDGSKVDVDNTHQVNGDVDLSTGNINFSGNVIVRGDVKEGMEINAKGSVEIKGSVYEADIKAEGQIIVNKGFIGSASKGLLDSDSNIEVKFIENGKVKAEKDLVVRDAIIHSDVDVGKTITVEYGKGLISGGTVRAGEAITAKVIGSNLATSTTVAVGITPELRDEYHQIKEDLEGMQSDLNETVKNVNLLKKVKEKQDGLDERKELLLNQLIRKRFSLSKEIEDLKKEKEELAEKLEKRKEGTIKVKKEINPGVVVMIGTYKKKVTEKNTNVKYYVEKGDIKSTSCV